MANTVTVKHNAELGHRLYPLGGKCSSLHGHSWYIEVTVQGELQDGVPIIVDFGSLKKDLRTFVDENLDHGLALGYGDPLLASIIDDGGKVFIFGNEKWDGPHENKLEEYAEDLKWPTVEAMSILIARVMKSFGHNVVRVHVSETAVNAATWTEDN